MGRDDDLLDPLDEELDDDELLGEEPERPRRREPRRKVGGRVRELLRSAFVENAPLKFVAFVLSLTVFILVHSDDDIVRSVSVPLEYSMPKDQVLVREPPDEVRVTVRGSRRRVGRFLEAKIKPVEINLSNHSGDEYVFQNELIQLPEGVTLTRFTPPAILTDFEKQDEKAKPVSVAWEQADVTPGYVVVQPIVVEPSEVMIVGAKSVVAGIEAVSTTKLDLRGRSTSFETEVALVRPSAYVEFKDAPESGNVKVSVTIVQEQHEKHIKAVKVVTRAGADVSEAAVARFVVAPETVQVWLRGPRVDLDEVDLGGVTAFVELSADDVAVGRTRQARVVVVPPKPGIAVLVRPQEVTVGPKGAVTPPPEPPAGDQAPQPTP